MAAGSQGSPGSPGVGGAGGGFTGFGSTGEPSSGAFYFGDISADNNSSINNAKEAFGLHARYYFKSI